MNQYERAIGHAAIRTFGRIPNIIKAIEELSELQQALCKHVVSEQDAMTVASVHEEIADVQIMLGRLMMLFDPTEVQDWKDSKLEKTARLLGLEMEGDGDNSGETMKGNDLIRHGCAAPPSPEGEGFGETCDRCAVCEGPEEPTGEAMEEMRL